MEKLKKPPANKDAEMYVLSLMLESRENREDLLLALREEDFFFLENKIIFQEICHLNDKVDVNIEVLASSLKNSGNLDKSGGINYLLELNYLGSGADLNYYLSQLIEMSNARSLVRIGKDLCDRAFEGDGGDELIYDTMKRIGELGRSCHQPRELKQILANYEDGKSYLEVLEERTHRTRKGEIAFRGILSGFDKLDEIIGGFSSGGFVVIGARPSMGKTTFVINLIFNICKNNPEISVGFFSLEMSEEILALKMICAKAGLNFKKVEKGFATESDLLRIQQAGEDLAESDNVIFMDKAAPKISEIKTIARRLVLRNKVSIIFIDYLTLIRPDSRQNNKHLEVDEISKGLQALAKDLGIPIVCLAQLNRQITFRNDKRPLLSDLRESGSIEEDADLVLMLHRPRMYDSTKVEDLTELYVVKNRVFGDLGKVSFKFNNGRFIEQDKVEELLACHVYGPRSGDEKEEVYL